MTSSPRREKSLTTICHHLQNKNHNQDSDLLNQNQDSDSSNNVPLSQLAAKQRRLPLWRHLQEEIRDSMAETQSKESTAGGHGKKKMGTTSGTAKKGKSMPSEGNRASTRKRASITTDDKQVGVGGKKNCTTTSTSTKGEWGVN
jgi:hypothetical protein